MIEVYTDLDEYILRSEYDVRAFGYDPYNAREFVERWATDNGPYESIRLFRCSNSGSGARKTNQDRQFPVVTVGV